MIEATYFFNTFLQHHPCNFHCLNFEHRTAGHQIKPNLSGVLAFAEKCCNPGNKNHCRTNTADQVWNADKWKYPWSAAAINSTLNCFIQPVPRRSKAAKRIVVIVVVVFPK